MAEENAFVCRDKGFDESDSFNLEVLINYDPWSMTLAKALARITVKSQYRC